MRREAPTLPAGKAREAIFAKAEQLDTACQINDFVAREAGADGTSGLQKVKRSIGKHHGTQTSSVRNPPDSPHGWRRVVTHLGDGSERAGVSPSKEAAVFKAVRVIDNNLKALRPS